MNKTDIQKSLCGPFEDENKPGEFYTFDKAGNAVAISIASLAEGTASSLISDPTLVNDLTIGVLKKDQGDISFGAAEGHHFEF